MPLLELKDIAYRIEEKEILSGLCLSMEPGEVHALLGPNGAGKSTVGCLIMGCEGYAATTGKILMERKEINGLGIHERARLGISMAWQEPVRFEGISVKDYLTIKNRSIDPGFYLELAGLDPAIYLNRMVDKSLSGGERKRIELASILTLNSKLAILDEPDSGIDMLSTKDIVNVINAFKKNGSAVLLITHKEEIAVIADRASQLCGGKIVCSGDPQKVAQYYKSRQCLACDREACLFV